MKKSSLLPMLVAFLGLLFVGVSSLNVAADGSETLGPPSITIATGTGIAGGGTGLFTQPGSINVAVPAGVTVKQVLLYWQGRAHSPSLGDNTATVNGNPVTGTLIGTSDSIYANPDLTNTTYRADITSLGLVSAGANSLTVSGIDFGAGGRNNGAGVLVIYDEGTNPANIQIRDGEDYAFLWEPDAQSQGTNQVQFFFNPEGTARTATVELLVGGIGGPNCGDGTTRPHSLIYTVGGVSFSTSTTIQNPFTNEDGCEWDSHTLQVPVPSNATFVTVELFSTGGPEPTIPAPASFQWTTAAFAIAQSGGGGSGPQEPPPGQEIGTEGCTPGYWKNHPNSWDSTGFSQSQTVESVFDVPDSLGLDSLTLQNALKGNGGSGTTGAAKVLLRAAVAALLNASNPDVDYTRTVAEIIEDVNAALASGNRDTMLLLASELDQANNGGCPIN